MPVVAIAGGTGQLGRTLADAIIAEGTNEVVILARKGNAELEKTIGARIIPVDYDNVGSLVEAFDDHHIDTLISTINSQNPSDQTEFNLIKAAEQSRAVKRYIPSLWGTQITSALVKIAPFQGGKAAVLEAVKQTTSLQWAVIYNGFFSDYFVVPKIDSYFSPVNIGVDPLNNAAGIPGTGDEQWTTTYTRDVAKYVAALVSTKNTDKWDHEYTIIGSTTTFNEIVKVLEQAKGDGVKYDVQYDSEEKLASGKITELPGHTQAYAHGAPRAVLEPLFAQFGLMFAHGHLDVSKAKGVVSLNDKFPEIRPKTIRELNGL